jgi:hypothetical protein
MPWGRTSAKGGHVAIEADTKGGGTSATGATGLNDGGGRIQPHASHFSCHFPPPLHSARAGFLFSGASVTLSSLPPPLTPSAPRRFFFTREPQSSPPHLPPSQYFCPLTSSWPTPDPPSAPRRFSFPWSPRLPRACTRFAFTPTRTPSSSRANGRPYRCEHEEGPQDPHS